MKSCRRDQLSEVCLCSGLFIWNHRRRQDICLSFVSASFPLLLLLVCFLRWLCWDTFLLFLFQAAQRIRTLLFPLSLTSTPLFILLMYSLLLFQAEDLLLLAWIDHLSHLDGLDIVEGFLWRFVQYNGVENDVKQGNTRNFIQGCS